MDTQRKHYFPGESCCFDRATVHVSAPRLTSCLASSRFGFHGVCVVIERRTQLDGRTNYIVLSVGSPSGDEHIIAFNIIHFFSTICTVEIVRGDKNE